MSYAIDPTLADDMAGASVATKADLLLGYLVDHGTSNYDESVTQLEHALQSAALARADGAAPETVVSALLHDLGHLLIGEHDGSIRHGYHPTVQMTGP